jgi:NAD(P)-dependent dehydrogenase (short-subunit alcohol dehydrogenase family)
LGSNLTVAREEDAGSPYFLDAKEMQAMSQTNSGNSISGRRTGSAMSDLAAKVLIVTGASHGIGAAAARLFSRSGANVVLAAREEQALKTVAADIASEGKQTLAVPTDVTDAAAVERLVAGALERYGQLDGAFNNAGSGQRPTPLVELAQEEFDRVLDVNLRSVFLCMRAELKEMVSGAIVNMTSTAGLSGAPGMAAYSAAKHGVVGLTETAALDYGPKGIRVNAVAPGPILTERGIGTAPAEVQEQVAQRLPIKRLGTPEEVAHAAAWLLSDASSFVNGATLSIDGGKLAGSAAL